MSAARRGRRLRRALGEGGYRFGIINFANPDMVGHTGVIPAAVAAVEAVDALPRRGRRGGRTRAAAPASSPPTTATADHMLEPDGSPNTAHSPNPVPLIVTAAGLELRDGGILADVAPTALRAARDRPARGDDRRARCSTELAELEARPMRRRSAARLRFEIEAPATARARAGVLHTAHGTVADAGLHPAGDQGRRCAGSSRAEVAELGYELVLGNTFHLFVSPGPERIAAARRAARVHGLGAGAHHRLRRLPGLLARPRRRRRRDQGQRRGAAASQRLDGRDRRGGRRASAPTATAPSASSRPRSR